MRPTVTIAILARNKAHCLPEYLACIERLDYPKDKIALQVRTNDNADDTEDILCGWLNCVDSKYMRIDYDSSPLNVKQSTNPHDWTPDRLSTIAKIRQESLDKFRAAPTDYYFVVDCDNFIAPYTLSALLDCKRPIVAPMLDTLPNEDDLYSNFFAACDVNGFWADTPIYGPIRTRKVRGAFEMPVVHCTYLVERRVIDQGLVYYDGRGQFMGFEFLVFSYSARKSGVEQFLINDRVYGYLLHHETNHEKVALEQESDLYAQQCRPTVLSFLSSPERKRVGEEAFHGWYSPGGMGSGPGSAPAYTERFRAFLADFMRKHDVKTVVDYGCGDWQWAKLVDWPTYQGFDIVPSLVERLQREHGSDRISFQAVEDVSVFEPPECDLLICKDVLQHLPNAEAVDMIARFSKRAKYVLWVNDRHPNPAMNNADTPVGGYRHMDLSKPPFSIIGRTVFEFGFAGDYKVAFLQGDGPEPQAAKSGDLLTLVMIVKDEAHTIAATLESVRPAIDRYCILDTGSTDGTQDVIRRTFADIPGEVHEEPFVDFATTRNRALELAGTQTAYALMLDADDVLVGADRLRQFLTSVKSLGKDDGYHLKIHVPGAEFNSCRLTRTLACWRYQGAVHELLLPPDSDSFPAGMRAINGVRIDHFPTETGNVRSEARWHRDLAILQRELEKNPADARSAFYLARTLEWLQRFPEAVTAYEKRIDLEGYSEEVFCSYLYRARCARRAGTPQDTCVGMWLEAHSQDPRRVEPLADLAAEYSRADDHALCALFARAAFELPPAHPDALFVERHESSVANLLAWHAWYLDPAAWHEIGLKAARKAVELEPGDGQRKKNLGLYLGRK